MPLPAIVQQVTGAPGNVTNFSTSAVTTTAGNTLVLLIGRGSGTTGNVTGVTDPVGNTWAVATRGGQGGSSNTHCEVWTTTQNVGPLTAQAISVTTSAANLTVYNVVEIRNLDRSALVEAVSPDPSGAAASSTHSTPTVVTARTEDFILSVINHAYNASADTFTSTGGTQLTSVVSGTDFRMSAGYYLTTVAGSFDGDWTLPASLAAGLITVAIRQYRAFAVLVDWNKDGDYTDAGEDVTNYVRPGHGAVVAEYGRDQSTALAPTVAGRGSLVLDNRDKRFSSRNASSPLYGNIKPARPVKITRTVGVTNHTLFVGHTDDSPLNPNVDSKTVNLSLVDSLADFRGHAITTPLYSGIRSGTAIGYILDAIGWPTSLRDLDPGVTYIPWFWIANEDVLTALEKVVSSEGPPALLTVGVSGEIMFKDRHHRLTDTASLTSQQTWRDETTEPIMQSLVYDEGWQHIVNTGTVDVDVRTSSVLQQVWQQEGQITLAGGEQRVITASTNDPFHSAVVPASGTDYTLLSGAVTVALLRDSGASVGIVLTAGGSGAVISDLQLRAVPVTVAHTIQISHSDATSITDYGRRSFPSDLPFCNPYDAEAVLLTTVSQRSQPASIVEASFQIINDTKAALLLPRDLSDRVAINEDETALANTEFFIEKIAHEITGDGGHRITFGTEAAPTGISPVFRFDTSGQGFNDGKFGGGIDDPTLMFRFDASSSGHRFDDGFFAN